MERMSLVVTGGAPGSDEGAVPNSSLEGQKKQVAIFKYWSTVEPLWDGPLLERGCPIQRQNYMYVPL